MRERENIVWQQISGCSRKVTIEIEGLINEMMIINDETSAMELVEMSAQSRYVQYLEANCSKVYNLEANCSKV